MADIIVAFLIGGINALAVDLTKLKKTKSEKPKSYLVNLAVTHHYSILIYSFVQVQSGHHK